MARIKLPMPSWRLQETEVNMIKLLPTIKSRTLLTCMAVLLGVLLRTETAFGQG
jgi:hypothetical protein